MRPIVSILFISNTSVVTRGQCNMWVGLIPL
uniref:Uncharacterized protein n=1 Tax=Anguilla anguilla TaxID=7936 RepID=A0A0E9QY56_ANGAN